LIARASAWVERLQEAGLHAGEPVALALSRGPDLGPLHLAALAGANPIVPLNTSMATPEVASVLEAARPRLVIAAASFFEQHAAFRAKSRVPWWIERIDAPVSRGAVTEHDCSAAGATAAHREDGPHAVAERPESRLEATQCSDCAPAIVLFTSGTTGEPKSVPLSHANLRANLLALAALWQRSSDDRLLHVLPAHHFHGLVLGLYGSLLAANTVVLMPGFDAAATLAAIPAFDINLLMGVPTVYARLLEHGAPPGALAALRLAISGSAPLPAALWEAFRERFGVALVNRYGLTETAIVTSTSHGTQRAGTVGKPLPGTEVSICDKEGRYHGAIGAGVSGGSGSGAIGAGVSGGSGSGATARGEICVRGPSVTSGYGNAPEANAHSFRDGLFHTGDLGHFDEHGDLWVEGRLKELIIVGGSNVIPGEVETPLSSVEGVAEIVVAGAPHRDLGEIVVAYVVARSSDTERLEKDLRIHANLTLAAYKRPRAYFFVDAIPRNAMGKVDRKRLL